MNPTTGNATGTIEVKSYVPVAYAQAEKTTLNEITITETFSGDVVGEGAARLLQAVEPDGSASFCGIERVVGTLANRRGTFLLQDQGTVVGDRVEGRWFVIPGSGTGELAGLRGEGGFTAKLGEHAHWTLAWRLE